MASAPSHPAPPPAEAGGYTGGHTSGVQALSAAFKKLPMAAASKRRSARAQITPHAAEKIGRAVTELAQLIGEAADRGDMHVTLVSDEVKGGLERHPERRLCAPLFALKELDLLLLRHLLLKRGYHMSARHVAGLHREDVTWKEPDAVELGEYDANSIAEALDEATLHAASE